MARAATDAKGRNTRPMPTLKNVWALATWRAGSPVLMATRAVNGPMNGSTRATPPSLNPMWATATRLASALAPIEAISAVAQVPTLAPSTSVTAPGRWSSPSLVKARISPIVAADEVTSALNPAATRTPSIVLSATAARTWVASALALSGAIPSRISLRPRNRSPKPSTAWPVSFSARRPATNITVKPSPTSNSA